MFSPTLFYDYYSINDYEILESQVFFYTKNHESGPWQIFDYVPGCLDHLSFGGFDNGFLMGISFVARKTESSVSDRTPQQGFFLKLWKDRSFEPLQEKYRSSIKANSAPLGAVSRNASFWKRWADKLMGRRQADPFYDRKVAEY
jgi:hypothetical protein